MSDWLKPKHTLGRQAKLEAALAERSYLEDVKIQRPRESPKQRAESFAWLFNRVGPPIHDLHALISIGLGPLAPAQPRRTSLTQTLTTERNRRTRRRRTNWNCTNGCAADAIACRAY